jgi:hypothetical protein
MQNTKVSNCVDFFFVGLFAVEFPTVPVSGLREIPVVPSSESPSTTPKASLSAGCQLASQRAGIRVTVIFGRFRVLGRIRQQQCVSHNHESANSSTNCVTPNSLTAENHNLLPLSLFPILPFSPFPLNSTTPLPKRIIAESDRGCPRDRS